MESSTGAWKLGRSWAMLGRWGFGGAEWSSELGTDQRGKGVCPGELPAIRRPQALKGKVMRTPKPEKADSHKLRAPQAGKAREPETRQAG